MPLGDSQVNGDRTSTFSIPVLSIFLTISSEISTPELTIISLETGW